MTSFRKNQSGFTAIEGIVVAVILAIIGFTGYYVWHRALNTKKTDATTAASSQAKTSLNYYDCIDKYDGVPNGTDGVSCTFQGKTYQLPSTYTQDMIRGYQKLPVNAQAVVIGIAQTLYKQDSAPTSTVRGPAEVIVVYVNGTKFIKLDDYAGFASPVILYNDNNQWKPISFNGGDYAIACSVIQQYQIPLAVLQSGKGANSLQTCTNADGSSQPVTSVTN